MEKIVVYFGQGKFDPMLRELDKLQPLVDSIEAPGTTVKLFGHASKEGSDQKNLELSQKRAETVQAYLIAMGATAEQISVTAFGERRPAVRETGSGAQLESLRAQNRRVEVEYVAGQKPNRYQTYLDRYRQRLKTNIANGQQRVGRLQLGEQRTQMNPRKVPAVLIHWRSELDASRRQLESDRKELRNLESLENALRDPKKVWDMISPHSSAYAARVRSMRELVEDTRRRLAEAEKQRLADPQQQSFWSEVVLEYKAILKERHEELQWSIKDQQEDLVGKT